MLERTFSRRSSSRKSTSTDENSKRSSIHHNDYDSYYQGSQDKQWAKRYILDPLTDPEPSQETGPGSSFYNPNRHSVQVVNHRSVNSTAAQIIHTTPKRPTSLCHVLSQDQISLGKAPSVANSTLPPTPPGSASPSRNTFVLPPVTPSSPISPTSSLSRTNSASHQSRPSRLSRPPSVANRHSIATTTPPAASSALHRSNSINIQSGGLQRSLSINGRYAGDMSHRPLDIIRQEARVADRGAGKESGHRRRSRAMNADTIDLLDTIGGAYHHSGPYDATLTQRNLYPESSPVAAVQETNNEAIKATPRVNIMDSLHKKVPLQGTASVPPNHADLEGNIMDYEEGADLMREPDAAGGAYKRWEGIQYHPDDLKGKGEPSYTFDEQKKERKRQKAVESDAGEIELQSGANASLMNDYDKNETLHVRHRSVGAIDPQPEASSSSSAAHCDVQRSNTTGKRLSTGLKRRLGSLRRKMEIQA